DSPLGKLLALDVDATQSPAPWEALALGFRNPWKWSVDAQSGAVFLGDVGNLEREELNRFVPGGNYGWPRFEGTREDEAMPLCEDCGALTEPVVEYCHNVGSSITAGVVYRGAGIPEMNGQYVFGDFGKGRLFLVPADATSTHDLVTIGTTAVSITGFVHDHAGELLLLDRSGGGFFRLETIDRSQDPPSRLSESGFVDPRDPWSPPEVALEYAIQWPFFSDDADKGRWIIPPEEGTATVLADGDLDFPPGTVFVKRFELDGRRVETRAFVHTEGGRWRGYSYRWRDDGRDATLLPGSARAQIGDVPWYFPSRTECLSCHTRAASFALGPTMPQLAGDPQQVEAMIDRGLLAADVELPAPLPAADGEEGVSVRARAYLDVNCASCHRPGGPGGGALDLRFDTPLEDSGLCGEAQVDTLGIDDPRIVAPGDLSRSVLWRRLVALDQTRMHPFRQTRDSQGETIIRAWIDEVQCP
ncbi:MAG: PQQ-dependent sugar dehydrogenase, partial [Myxococcota bacterium]